MKLNLDLIKRILTRYSKLIIEFFIIAWIVITITFILIHTMPGSELGGNLTDAKRAVLTNKYGLDKPLINQYFIFLGNLFKGDFGVSINIQQGVPISEFLWKRMGISFEIGIIALLLGISVGIALGILIGIKPGGFADNIGSIVISLGIAIPSFVIGLLLLLFGKSVGLPFIYDRQNYLSVLLPALAMSFGTIIVYMRYLRVELAQELNSNHYKFILVKGVTKRRFIIRHALRPALFPVVTFLPSAILGAFVGSMFVEGIFGVPGAGSLMIDAINSKDYNIIQSLVIIYTLMTIISFFLRDILYHSLDPRVRLNA